MSMTREEAIELLRDTPIDIRSTREDDIHTLYATAQMMAIDALRPVSRERMKKMRGEWMGSADGYADGELVYDMWECSHCGYVIDEEDDPDMLPQFCPKCCSIMTDEAVEIMLKRMEALLNDQPGAGGEGAAGGVGR